MANHGSSGGSGGSGGAPGNNHGDSAVKHNDGGDKPKGPQIEMQPITGAQLNRAEQARTNASDGSLKKYSPSVLEEQEHSIELVGYGKVVSRNNPGTEKDLTASPPPANRLDKSNGHQDSTFRRGDLLHRAAEHEHALDQATLKELSHQSPELKRLTENAIAHIKNPDCLHVFAKSLDKFQHRPHLSQQEKNETYSQLSRLLEAKYSNLEPFEKRNAKAGTWNSDVDSKANENLRAVLATDLLYHAANPHGIDQGAFNTCNVTTQAERLFVFRPSRAAEMAVTVALTCQWSPPYEKGGPTIYLDARSLRPAQDKSTTGVPPEDNVRSFDIQLLNVLMVNVVTQTRDFNNPQIYVQQDMGHSLNPVTNKFEPDNGEKLYYMDPVTHKELNSVKEPVMTKHGIVQKPVDNPAINVFDLARIGPHLTGDINYTIIAARKGNMLAGILQSDGIVNVDSYESLRNTLKDLKAHHHFPITIPVDAHSPLFDSGKNFQPRSLHVVTLWDFDEASNQVRISNQWGKEYDVKAHLYDLYDALNRFIAPDSDKSYEVKRQQFQHHNHVKQDTDL